MKSSAYTKKHAVSSVVMILTLLWLTVSLPVVYAAQQQVKQAVTKVNAENKTEKNNDCNPFANTTEEKPPANTSINLSEEYLHHHEEYVPFIADKLSHSHHHSYNTYVAYHGELLSPPPESFLA